MSGDVNSENESKSSEKGEPKDGSGTASDKMRKYVGVAFAGAYRLGLAVLAVQGASGISRAEGVSPPGASDTALALGGGKELTDRPSSSLAVPEQRANCIEGLPERKLSQDTPGSSDPDGTNKNLGVPDEDSPLRKLWPHLAEDIDKWAREGEQASKGLHQGEGQRKDDRETALDFRSRKVTLGEKTSRSVTDAHPDQLKQDKSERAESLKLSREEFDTLRTCAAFLKEHPEARKCLQMVQNDKEVMGGINDLIQDEGVRRCVISELKNKENVERAILLWENPKALQVLKKVFNNKKYMENFKHLIQDNELRAHDLYSLEDIRKLSLTKRMIQEVQQHAEVLLADNIPLADDTPSTNDTPNKSSDRISWSISMVGVAMLCVLLWCCYRYEQRNQNRQGNQGEQRNQNREVQPRDIPMVIGYLLERIDSNRILAAIPVPYEPKPDGKSLERDLERQQLESRGGIEGYPGGRPQSLFEEGSSSGQVDRRNSDNPPLLPIPSERMGPRNDEGIRRAMVRSMVDNERGTQQPSEYDDPGPSRRTNGSSSLEDFSPENP